MEKVAAPVAVDETFDYSGWVVSVLVPLGYCYKLDPIYCCSRQIARSLGRFGIVVAAVVGAFEFEVHDSR